MNGDKNKVKSGPAVSVVLPVFNGERTIRDAIDSVLEQTFGDFELLIWNDGSIDQTTSIVRSYSDPRIILLGSSANAGVGQARDAAINFARGKWLALIDADDVWKSFRLEQLMSAAGEAMDSMIFDDLMLCHDTYTGMVPWKRLRGPKAFDGSGEHPMTISAEQFIKSERYLMQPLIPMCWISAVQAKHGAQRFGEDANFYLQLIAKGLGLKYYPEAMYLYRITPGSLTSFRDRHVQMLEVLKEVEPLFVSSESMAEAVKYKIQQVDKSVSYSRILSLIKQGQLLAWMHAVFTEPWFIPMFLKKVTHDVQASFHGYLHGARKRGSQ